MPASGLSRVRLFVSLLLLAATQACGEQQAAVPSDGGMDTPSLDGSSEPDGGCVTYVSDSLIDHACFHEKMGPHAQRTASISVEDPSVAVDRAHTSFHVQLPARSDGRFAGVLHYQPRFAGEYAIFSRAVRALRVSADGASVASSIAHGTEICTPLPEVAVYPLEARSYTVKVESDQPEVTLVVESMSEGAVDDAYRTVCNGRPRARDAAVFTLDAAAHGGPLDAAAGDGGLCRVDPVLEHACLHVQNGPFADVTTDTSAPGPDISKAHTAWRVQLSAQSAGTLRFRPTTMGEHVFYLDQPLALRVHAGGEALPPTYSEPVTNCSGVSEARVFALTRGVLYDVELGPAPTDAALLVIESVQAFTDRGWRERFEACP